VRLDRRMQRLRAGAHTSAIDGGGPKVSAMSQADTCERSLHQIYPRWIFHTAMSDRGCSQEGSLVSSAVRGGDHSERVASSTTPSSAMLCVVNGPGKVQAAHVVPTYHALC
jgi:hypothetical protein